MDQLAHQALLDPLVNLPNYTLFTDRLALALERAQRTKTQVAVLVFDLDSFKVINDSLGREAGNQVLIETARRIQACVGSERTVGRMGADEFLVLQDNITDLNELWHLTARIREVLRAPYQIGGHEMLLTCSVGIAVHSAEGDTPKSLIRHADVALTSAKANGQDSCEIYDLSMNTEALDRLTLAADLHRALSRDELQVWYQPLVDLNTGHITAAEALLRWDHPTRGFISPEEFIPVAEETGLIEPIGRWMIHEACGQARSWQEVCSTQCAPAVSINLSACQFQDPHLISSVGEALGRQGLSPSALLLEITESAVLEGAATTVQTFKALKAMGIRIALDDFGTGYSSFSYLSRLSIDMLKVDRCFVSNLGSNFDNAAIVRTMITLGRSLHMKVTAEGVETSAEAVCLQELGADYGQGYFYSPPVPAPEFCRLLEQWDSSKYGKFS